MTDMSKLLAETLKEIECERPRYDLSFTLADKLVAQYGEQELPDKLYEGCDSSVKWPVIADLFSILIWSTSDNGQALMRTMERWIIECNDERKVNIAINLDCAPFRYLPDMMRYLGAASEKFPSTRVQCANLLNWRMKLGE